MDIYSHYRSTPNSLNTQAACVLPLARNDCNHSGLRALVAVVTCFPMGIGAHAPELLCTLTAGNWQLATGNWRRRNNRNHGGLRAFVAVVTCFPMGIGIRTPELLCTSAAGKRSRTNFPLRP